VDETCIDGSERQNNEYLSKENPFKKFNKEYKKDEHL